MLILGLLPLRTQPYMMKSLIMRVHVQELQLKASSEGTVSTNCQSYECANSDIQTVAPSDDAGLNRHLTATA